MHMCMHDCMRGNAFGRNAKIGEAFMPLKSTPLHKSRRSVGPKPTGSRPAAGASRPTKAKMASGPHRPAATPLRTIRAGFGISRARFSRLTGFSERALADWEAEKRTPDAPAMRRLKELARLQSQLARIMQPAAIAEWLDTPNSAFDGLKPIEVIDRGEIDRLWLMIYELGSGTPG